MDLQAKINAQLQRLITQGDWRFALGLHIRFNHPTLMYQTYPEDWVQYYAKNGLMFADPTLLWGMTNFGTCDWKDLEHLDVAGVLRQARAFGLVQGIAVSVGDVSARSLGFFTHHDTPIGDAMRETAEDVMVKLHEMTVGITDLPKARLDELASLNDDLRGLRT
jgi:LuxR family transcriptional regulator, quorum-sensing system regulator SdiA